MVRTLAFPMAAIVPGMIFSIQDMVEEDKQCGDKHPTVWVFSA
jgi:hypothetical protein